MTPHLHAVSRRGKGPDDQVRRHSQGHYTCRDQGRPVDPPRWLPWRPAVEFYRTVIPGHSTHETAILMVRT